MEYTNFVSWSPQNFIVCCKVQTRPKVSIWIQGSISPVPFNRDESLKPLAHGCIRVAEYSRKTWIRNYFVNQFSRSINFLIFQTVWPVLSVHTLSEQHSRCIECVRQWKLPSLWAFTLAKWPLLNSDICCVLGVFWGIIMHELCWEELQVSFFPTVGREMIAMVVFRKPVIVLK